MTVQELIQKLSDFKGDAEVLIDFEEIKSVYVDSAGDIEISMFDEDENEEDE